MPLDRQRRDVPETWVALRIHDIAPVKRGYGLFDLTPILALHLLHSRPAEVRL